MCMYLILSIFFHFAFVHFPKENLGVITPTAGRRSSSPTGQHARCCLKRPLDRTPLDRLLVSSVFFDFRSISAVKSNKFDLHISRFVIIKCPDFS